MDEDASFPPQTNDWSDSLLASGLAKRDLIASGELDYGTVADGTALLLQFANWGGVKGFKNPPTTDLVIENQSAGKYTNERGLLFARIPSAGKTIAMDAPQIAFTLQQYLYGLINL